MSRSLRSMPVAERARAVKRRIKEQRGGNGFWAAVDSLGGNEAGVLIDTLMLAPAEAPAEDVTYTLDLEDTQIGRGRRPEKPQKLADWM